MFFPQKSLFLFLSLFLLPLSKFFKSKTPSKLKCMYVCFCVFIHCNKNINIIIMKKRTKKQSKDSSSSSSSLKVKPFGRKNRTKTRKPKFLSLRLQLSQPNKTTMIQQEQQQEQQQPQLNLFPLHPENTVVDEKLDMHEETNDVALLFTSDCSATLNGLLEDESTITKNTTSSEEEEGSFSAFDGGGGGGGGESGSWLVRKAMRRCSKEDDGCEERWVCYSEVTSATVSAAVKNNEAVVGGVNTEDVLYGTTSFGVLSLKLDHEGIMNAWSDKGSLYVEGEVPQTVPNFHHHHHFLHNPNVPWDGWGSDAGNTWTVPESCGANNMNVKEEMGWKLGQREASVLRYKEKRQSRLFSKRIRYEVRKLNAEKRPRMKGRFVKRG